MPPQCLLTVFPPLVSKKLPALYPQDPIHPLSSLPSTHMTLLHCMEGCVGCVVLSPGLSQCATAWPVASTAWGGSDQAPTPILTTIRQAWLRCCTLQLRGGVQLYTGLSTLNTFHKVSTQY